MVSVSDPESIKKILAMERAKYAKDDWSYKFFKPILGTGLVTAEGELWKRQRGVMGPMFHYNSLARLFPVFTGAADR